MKLSSRTAAFAALAAAFLLGTPVLAQATPLGNGGGRYVNSQSQTNQFAFSVVRLPNGAASGHVVFHFPEGDAMVHMEVTSFLFLGDQLGLAGVVTKAVNTPRQDLVGSTAFLALTEGPDGGGHTGFSALPRALGQLTAQQVAALLNITGPLPPEAFYPVVSGNVTIH